ncbi:MAG: CoA pyrophosphatase [Myxococcales bacterium]|nr:CoA pyrophosphatase [Myxococcales bacterium]
MVNIARVRETLAGSLPSSPDPEGPSAAAVATILRDAPGGLEVLFIRRAERDGDPWSGHMAFPGGRREPHDVDLLSTAIRETIEEIGVDLTRDAELVGVLDDQDATGRRSREPLPTRPFVFELRAEPRVVLSSEVTEVLWAPVEPLLRGERGTSVDVTYKGDKFTLPAWDVEGRIVWGLTYRMLSTLFGRLGPVLVQPA